VIWVKYGCYTCHGYAAQGGAGATLFATPPPLPAFTRYVRRPTGVMPPYGESMVTDQEMADIHAFLVSLPKPVDPATIPLLQGLDK
jgi:mono/diheme cytochrome c family protein